MQCRTCGDNAENGVSLLEPEQDRLLQLISENLQAQVGGQFPTMMCQRCIKEICHWKWFRNRLNNSRQRCQQMLKSLAQSTVHKSSDVPGKQLDILLDYPSGDVASNYAVSPALPECRVLLHRLVDCNHCDKVFSNVTELDLHRNLTHNQTKNHERFKKIFKCCTCNLTFMNQNNLVDHRKYFHDGENPMGKIFKNNACKKIYQCTSCLNEFTIYRSFVHHINSQHLKLRPFQCDVCPKNYTTILALNNHQNIHNKKTWTCDTCNARFKLKSYLREHILKNLTEQAIHQGVHFKYNERNPRKFICSKCSLIFTYHEYLKHHNNYIHGDNPMGKVMINEKGKKVFYCIKCKREFTRSITLLDHISAQHTNLRRFQCNLCKKCYHSSAKLRHHKQNHDKQTFNCNICSAKFKRKLYLKEHILRAHSKSVKCKICERKCKSQAYLSAHMKNVHGIRKRFSCKHCKKSFTKLYILNSHNCKFVHSKKLSFQCYNCNS